MMAFGEFESTADKTSYVSDGPLENDSCITKIRRTKESRDMVTGGCDSSYLRENQNKCDSAKSPKVSSTSSAELSSLGQQRKKGSSHSSSPDTTVREDSYNEGNTCLTSDESKTLKSKLESQISTKFCNADRKSCDTESCNGVDIMSAPSSHKKRNSKITGSSTDSDDARVHSKNNKYSKRTESSSNSDEEEQDRLADNISEKLRKRSQEKCSSSSSSKDSKSKRSPVRIPKSYMKYYNRTAETKRCSSDSRTSRRSSFSSHSHSRKSREDRTSYKNNPIERRTHSHRRNTGLLSRERDNPCNGRSVTGMPGRTHLQDNFAGSSSVLTSPIVACSNCRHYSHQALTYISTNVPHGAHNRVCLDNSASLSVSRNRDLDCKVYIGGLNEYATRQEIRRVFSKYGTLKNLWIAKNPPGFAFVEYVDPKDAKYAVKMVNGKTVCGTRVKVQKSNGLRHTSIRMTNGLPRHFLRERRHECRVYRRRPTT